MRPTTDASRTADALKACRDASMHQLAVLMKHLPGVESEALAVAIPANDYKILVAASKIVGAMSVLELCLLRGEDPLSPNILEGLRHLKDGRDDL